MTPSSFYRNRRPEFFSDTIKTPKPTIQREVLAYELSMISTNQKQDEFETLCRRLSEKYIAPNLIPQVGPTGGGDGKTDFETHSVSSIISNKWFIPENGWKNGEKWAFAISAKKDWKTKVKKDVENIVNTKREYTKIYFISNQLISSKKKKETQDELIEKFSVDVIILDGEWILENVYNNSDLNIVIESLNLSNSFMASEVVYGSNDVKRQADLDEIELNLQNNNRYLEYDFQLVEDALQAAILSRMLEKPKDEVEGKFDRVFRFCKKLNITKYYIKYHYQRAWTYLYWYDDYESFIEQYIELKKYITNETHIDYVEQYFNLYNSLFGLTTTQDLNFSSIDIQQEKNEILVLLDNIKVNKKRPTSSLIAETYIALITLNERVLLKESLEEPIEILISVFTRCEGLIEYPFDSIKQIVEELGNILVDLPRFDDLIDIVAEINQKRTSELSTGQMFLRRGGQKLKANLLNESIIYFGKAVQKLSKEETQYGMCLSLMGLGSAYSGLGLLWAANTSFVSACSISFKLISEDGDLKNKTFQTLIEILTNELFIGRLPMLLSWYEMLIILFRTYNIDYEKYKINDIPFLLFFDSCLSIRFLNSDTCSDYFTYIYDPLKKLDLELSYLTTLYILGYEEEVSKRILPNSESQDLNDYFSNIFNQPFKDQIVYKTDAMDNNTFKYSTKILGSNFIVYFEKKCNLSIIAETFLAYSEAFFSTSIKNIIAHRETIELTFVESENSHTYKFERDETSGRYLVKVNVNITDERDKHNRHESLFKLIVDIMVNNFLCKDMEKYLSNLYKNQEVHERVSLIHEHDTFFSNLLGNNPKIFLSDWVDIKEENKKIVKRTNPISFESSSSNPKPNRKVDFNSMRHDKMETQSIINVGLWDKALWSGLGVIYHESIGLGIAICFSEIKYGISIFEEWINQIGNIDRDNKIRVTIIKGINKNNPYWYRVIINTNIDKGKVDHDKCYILSSRIHDMKAVNDSNIKLMESIYKKDGRFMLLPGHFKDEGKMMEPIMDKSIIKTNIYFRNAWEIGEGDLDSVGIRKDDQPIIPTDVKDPPVNYILKNKKF